MINPALPQGGNQDEPIEIREWTKTQLFNRLTETYLLPSKESRGITRTYLVAVYEGRVFRIERSVLLQFESHLTMAEQRKSVFYNVGLLVERLERLLRLENQRPLGFTVGTSPEEVWFTRIVRYLDPTNILGAFRIAVQGAPVPDIFAARA